MTGQPIPLVSTFKALYKSFVYAAQGISFCVRTQRNARIHLIAAATVCVVAVSLQVSANDWRWLIACITLVWLAELMNTAFEYLCDLLSPEHNTSVKRAKDIAAGAVLVCASGAAVVGVMTFWPYLYALI